jgi:hypothetical protein
MLRRQAIFVSRPGQGLSAVLIDQDRADLRPKPDNLINAAIDRLAGAWGD